MKFKKLSLSLLGGVLLLSGAVSASAPDFRFSSLREKAMGGASIAIANDFHALHQNPAGLSQIRDLHLDLLRIRPEFNDSILKKVTDLQDIQSSSDKASQLSSITALVPLDLGFNAGGSALSLSWTGFACGAFLESHLFGALKNQSNPTLKLEGILDAAGMIGFSTDVTVANTDLALGATFKYIPVRYTVVNSQDDSTTIEKGMADILKAINENEFETEYKDGSGFGFDVGILAALHSPIGSGKWGVVVKNIATTLEGKTYDVSGNVLVNNKDEIPMTAAIGMGVETRLPAYIPFLSDLLGDFTLAADYKFISPDTSIYKNINIGMEKSIFFNMIKLRGGLNQGFIVGGFGLDLFILHLDYAYYTEALGSEINIDPVSHHLVELGIYF